MFKKLMLKIAARKVESVKKNAEAKKNAPAPAQKKQTTDIWSKMATALISGFNSIKRGLSRFWNWLRSIDLIGMLNLTLLTSIIVLFSVLILNILNHDKKTVVIMAKNTVQETISTPFPKLTSRKPALVSKRTNKVLARPARFDKIKVQSSNREVQGNVVIDGNFPNDKLSNGMIIKGSLYLQNMHKYTLPCKIYIHGDLFLRNVDMLRFAGRFVVTGNIYVSHNSSFGPLPRTAELGGQVIL